MSTENTIYYNIDSRDIATLRAYIAMYSEELEKGYKMHLTFLHTFLSDMISNNGIIPSKFDNILEKMMKVDNVSEILDIIIDYTTDRRKLRTIVRNSHIELNILRIIQTQIKRSLDISTDDVDSNDVIYNISRAACSCIDDNMCNRFNVDYNTIVSIISEGIVHDDLIELRFKRDDRSIEVASVRNIISLFSYASLLFDTTERLERHAASANTIIDEDELDNESSNMLEELLNEYNVQLTMRISVLSDLITQGKYERAYEIVPLCITTLIRISGFDDQWDNIFGDVIERFIMEMDRLTVSLPKSTYIIEMLNMAQDSNDDVIVRITYAIALRYLVRNFTYELYAQIAKYHIPLTLMINTIIELECTNTRCSTIINHMLSFVQTFRELIIVVTLCHKKLHVEAFASILEYNYPAYEKFIGSIVSVKSLCTPSIVYTLQHIVDVTSNISHQLGDKIKLIVIRYIPDIVSKIDITVDRFHEILSVMIMSIYSRNRSIIHDSLSLIYYLDYLSSQIVKSAKVIASDCKSRDIHYQLELRINTFTEYVSAYTMLVHCHKSNTSRFDNILSCYTVVLGYVTVMYKTGHYIHVNVIHRYIKQILATRPKTSNAKYNTVLDKCAKFAHDPQYVQSFALDSFILNPMSICMRKIASDLLILLARK